jgi:tetratricopeptide (TPR) repeat protein
MDTQADLLQKAQELQRNNKFKAASTIYRKLLKRESSHPIAQNNLATIFIEQGDYDAALGLLREAAHNYPGYADALANLTVCCGKLGLWQDCLLWSNRTLTHYRSNASAWLWQARARIALDNNRAAIHTLEEALQQPDCLGIEPIAAQYLDLKSRLGERASAIRHILKVYSQRDRADQRIILELLNKLATSAQRTSLFKKAIDHAISSKGSLPNLLYWKAHAQLDEGKEAAAIQSLMEVAKSDASHDGAWLLLGKILRKQKNFFKANACIKRSIKENKARLEAHQELTDCLIESKDYRQAIKHSAKARRQFPSDPTILVSHCHALLNGDKPGLALLILNAHSDKHPHLCDANTMNCKGLALLQKQSYGQAIRIFQRATSLARADAGIWNNRGMAYGLAQRSRPELSCYRRAIACNPEDAGSHVNLAMAYLAQQDFTKGLSEYEWRLKSNGGSLNAAIKGRIVERGDRPDDLVIVCEQGLGDTFQFCRYLYDLRQTLPGCKLILACPEKLTAILRHSLDIVDDVIGCESANLTDNEYQYLPMMSLPYFCGIHPHRSIAPATYLRVERDIKENARDLIRAHVDQSSIVIGLNWKGNPETERSNLRGRSMSLEEMKPLATALPHAVFVSLQKGAGSDELEACSFRQRFIRNQDSVSKELCFRYTAASCLACDYIVTTDTGLAHLSGALGHRTNVLLSVRPEWRWRGSTMQSPWYANVRLFRQQSPGNWQEPLLEAAKQISRQCP